MRSPEEYFAPYDAQKCLTCGQCLAACPVMNISEEKGRRAIADMRAGKAVGFLERSCQTCFTCNLACPQGANPARLIQEMFARSMAAHGPRRWSQYFQQQQDVNFRSVAAGVLPAEDRALLESWRREDPADEIAYPGCNMANTPWLARSPLLADFDIRGGRHVCCGEPFFRTGMESELRQCARRLNRWLNKLEVKRMVVLCTAGTCLFRYVLPQFGLTYKMEVTSYLEVVHERFKAGRYPITQPLNMKVTIQESCYGKMLGDDYMNKVRELLSLIGCETVEMKHHRDKSLCCGIGAGFPPAVGYHPLALIGGARRVWKEAAATGAERVVSYCSGCLLTMSAMGAFYPGNIGISHLLEMLTVAVGGEVKGAIKPVGRAMILGSMRHQFPRLVDFRRTKLSPFEP